jgi:hypothetical protein
VDFGFYTEEVPMHSRQVKSRFFANGLLTIAALGFCPPLAAFGQRVVLSENFQNDTPDTQPASANFYSRACVGFVNCATDPAKIVVTGGQFVDPFGPGNKSLVFHNPNSAAQAAITWTAAFEDDASTFRNGTIDFDLWMEKPLPVLGQPGGKFWSFLDVRAGYGGPDRNRVSTVNDVTVWPNFRVQNLFGVPEPLEQVVDAGGRFSLGLETTFTDGAADIFGPDELTHVRLEISGTPGAESYVIKVNNTPITWLQNGESSSPWVPDAPGINVLSFLTDASGFFSGGASNVYLDNLVVINNDLPPLPDLLGDYNDNGFVDAADYTVWRDNSGSSATLPNDAIGGTIGQPHYQQWSTNFGQSNSVAAAASVPEPTTFTGLALLMLGLSVGNLSWRASR